METMTISIKVKTCPTCNGKGKTEQNEYTPPFESFMGDCPAAGYDTHFKEEL